MFSFFIDIVDQVKVGAINRIAYAGTSVPGLVQNDSMIPYCNADNLPDLHDIGADNKKVYYCPHRIELELHKVYEFLLIDDTVGEEDVSHPIHMHGYAFEIVDMGSRDELNSGKSEFTKAKHSAPIKDTITIPSQVK